MLTRLKVSGFKNLVDVDIRFGAFTCIAGANGVGKSNLFDAIWFLGALADMPLIQAAQSIRDEDERTADIRNLFHKIGDEYQSEMSFEAEMIIPMEATDDLGQLAESTITHLKYSLTLVYTEDPTRISGDTLSVKREELVHFRQKDAVQNLLFPHKPTWRKSVISGRRNKAPFISTDTDEENIIIRLHQDGGSSGKPRPFLAKSLPRTLLSRTNAAEAPTAMVARREMQSWRLLQLEPSALRRPDKFTDRGILGTDGSHLPSTVERLTRKAINDDPEVASKRVLATISNRLAELIPNVESIYIDRDEARQRLTLFLSHLDKTSHPAHALSDGTLRFLALSVMWIDTEAKGVICLEEPENGIHPGRIPAMIELIRDLTTDLDEAIDKDNPLRQVIINTHSPTLVQQIINEENGEQDLVIAKQIEAIDPETGKRYKKAVFGALPGTWRTEKGNSETIQEGELMDYLNPYPYTDSLL